MDYLDAIKFARTTLSDNEDFTKNPLRWNDYVLATIAFLQHDRAALIAHRNNIVQGREHPGNAINLRLVNSLLRNFDKDYRFATSHIEP